MISNPDYVIKGPMGKGLDLHSSGIHIAFTGGTGVLPFLDLVAYLIRLNLGLVNEDLGDEDETIPNIDESLSRPKRLLFKDLEHFKFALYVSYPS